MGGNDSRTLRIGRFEFFDGTEITPKNASLAALKKDRITQRMLGNFGWTHVGRSFDGLHYVQNIGKMSLHVMGAVPTRGVFQTDGWGWVRTGFGYASLNGQHNGKRHSGDWRLFTLYYQDFRHGVLKTDNRALPPRQTTPRPYARFPFFNFLNNEDSFAEVILRPSKKAVVRSDFHNLRLSSRSDLWYVGGGVFQPWSFGYAGRPSNNERSLGKLIDASLDYTVNSHVSFTVYGGYAPGGEVAKRIYPSGKDAALGYVELSYKF
ncbi:MAG: hypothetical protein U0R19_10515 [Bryobacteraceae bacterium]